MVRLFCFIQPQLCRSSAEGPDRGGLESGFFRKAGGHEYKFTINLFTVGGDSLESDASGKGRCRLFLSGRRCRYDAAVS